MAWSRARANPAAAKCKPGALLSAKQEGADFRRARKLGQRHELVHHLLQQLAPRAHHGLGARAAPRVPPSLDEQPPGPPLHRQPLARAAAAGDAALLEPVEQRSEVGEPMRHALGARAARHLEAQRIRHVRSHVDHAVGRHRLAAHHPHAHRRALRSPLGCGSCCGGRRLRKALLLLRQGERELLVRLRRVRRRVRRVTVVHGERECVRELLVLAHLAW
mmetsp:Transcript_30798/g.78606  ORF Transcript_30798/g.78606 Transcript_30798/m.78606 type:complete len:219 (-) Transcript_30798:46-702(-)